MMSNGDIVRLLVFLGLVGSVYAAEGIILFAGLRRKTGRRRIIFNRYALVVHILAAVGVLCGLWGYFVEPGWIEVNRYQIHSEKVACDFRLIHITDLHCREEGLNQNETVEIVNSLDGDVILFTGDAFNEPSARDNFRQMMSNMKAKLGKYAVRGNWDDWSGGRNYFDGTAFEELDGDAVRVEKNGESICVCGLNWGKGDELDVLEDLSESQFNVFLHHTPDLVEKVRGRRVDLYLAGHTHGGQVRLPFYGSIITLSKFGKKYEAGMYRLGDMDMYVNRGIGAEGGGLLRVRFCCRPEICVIDVVGEKHKESR